MHCNALYYNILYNTDVQKINQLQNKVGDYLLSPLKVTPLDIIIIHMYMPLCGK